MGPALAILANIAEGMHDTIHIVLLRMHDTIHIVQNYGESWLRLRLRLLKRPPTPIRPSLNTGEDTGNPMCSYEEFKFAKQLKKPIAWLNMNGGDPPENPVVQMGLQGNIYHVWSQDRATIDWVFEKLAATRSLDTSAIPHPDHRAQLAPPPFLRSAGASKSLGKMAISSGGGGGGAAEEVSTSTRGIRRPTRHRLTASHPHHQPAVAPKPVAAAEEEEVCVCCGDARVVSVVCQCVARAA